MVCQGERIKPSLMTTAQFSCQFGGMTALYLFENDIAVATGWMSTSVRGRLEASTDKYEVGDERCARPYRTTGERVQATLLGCAATSTLSIAPSGLSPTRP